jgi:hypothetical protein
MTPEQQRIAIAEACGWTNVAPLIVKNVKHEGDDITVGIRSDDGWIPDYLNDLNAMHEAEKVLSEKQWVEYEEEIRTVVLGGIRLVSQWTKADIHATAAQKSKAFLRTLGLWQETPTQPQ